MALATLAGGPFGGWYYFGPKAQGGGYGGMVRLSASILVIRLGGWY